MVKVIGVKFRNSGRVYYFDPGDLDIQPGSGVIVETARGVEYGDVALGNRNVSVGEVVQPLKPVLRKSSAEDDAHFAANRELVLRALRKAGREDLIGRGADCLVAPIERNGRDGPPRAGARTRGERGPNDRPRRERRKRK